MSAPSLFSSLKEALADWEDPDVTAYYLGCCLGLMGPEDGSFDGFRKAKATVFMDNPVGNALYAMLDRLVSLGALLYNEPEMQYKWNPSFHGEWENETRAT